MDIEEAECTLPAHQVRDRDTTAFLVIRRPWPYPRPRGEPARKRLVAKPDPSI